MRDSDSFSSVIAGSGFQLARAFMDVSAVVPSHEHWDSHVVMVFSGRWGDHGPAGDWRLQAGDVLFHPGRTRHSNVCAAGTDIVVLSMTAQMLAMFCGLYGNVARSLRLTFDDLKGVPETLHAELQSRDPATLPIVEGLIVQMLALGSRASRESHRSAPSWFPRVVQFIRTNLAANLSVEAVAQAAGISASSLAHSFRAATGRTFATYVTEARVHAAARALRTTNDSVAHIALAFGFYDHSHLCRTFKALKRVTPLEYRRIRSARSRDEYAEGVDPAPDSLDAFQYISGTRGVEAASSG